VEVEVKQKESAKKCGYDESVERIVLKSA